MRTQYLPSSFVARVRMAPSTAFFGASLYVANAAPGQILLSEHTDKYMVDDCQIDNQIPK
jgi:hypothetical protein